MATTVLLIALNVIVSLLGFQAFARGDRPARFLFQPFQVARGRNLEGMLVSQFSHADYGHLIFNMLSLYFFAPVVAGLLGPADLLLVYGLGLAGSLLAVFLLRRNDPNYRVLGASGAISAVLLAAIVLHPSMGVYMYFIPIPIPGPLFAVLYLGASAYLMRRETGRTSHEAHLGGALAGFAAGAWLSPLHLGPLLERLAELLHRGP